MQIICHRGLWTKIEEQNTKQAFERALCNHFGIETDIRDDRGELVIAHDLPTGNEMKLEELFELYNALNSKVSLALNIKSDGLHKKLVALIEAYNIANYFLFDMSIPDLLSAFKFNLKCYMRMSEWEQDKELLPLCEGIWLDSFQSSWYDEINLMQLVKFKKQICIVSEELHKREQTNQWEMLRSFTEQNMSICTDFPYDFKQFISK